MLTEFKLHTGATVFVNAKLVRLVAGEGDKAVITFSNKHRIVVEATPSHVAAALDRDLD